MKKYVPLLIILVTLIISGCSNLVSSETNAEYSSFVQNILPAIDFSAFNLSWIEELIRYLFIWIVFLGIGVVYKSKEHAQVELLHHYAPEKWKDRLSVLIEIVNSAVFLFLMIYGWSILKFTAQQISPSMGINMTVIYSAVLISSVICLIHAFEHVIKIYDGKRTTAIADTINENTSVG